MISHEEVTRIAAEWSRQDGVRLGCECDPVVDEFDLGYVVWSRIPVDVPVAPGDGTLTVIDRETGEMTNWPRLPSPVVQDLYRQDRATRPPRIRTVDPAVELRRTSRRPATPGTAAHLSLGTDRYVARGAKGDLELRHHPLVAAYLADLPSGHLVRGGDRHAELIVLSDLLHEYDRRQTNLRQPTLTLPVARELLTTAHFALFRVRESGDPYGGPADRPCEPCLRALVHFGVLPWSDLAYTEESRPGPQPLPEPGRFPSEVGAALVEAGWRPQFGDDLLARNAIATVVETPGQRHRHTSFPAVESALTRFPGLVSARRGPGEQVWIRRFDLDPRAAAHTADSLGDFATLIRARLFPIGTEQGDSILAMDEYERVFALDQAGEWFIGSGIDDALTNLLLGRAAHRVHDDGTW
ncbi:SUKH-3 domain-containing protein [Plantactinospora sp. B5E13]|uniref:SUKH-3 domain-containing protein n=1 Tax=unclassified Plantactinospora TaxID=2631981 RepID=UPI00325CC5F5